MLLFVLKLVIYYQLFYYYVLHELVTKSFSYYITMEQNIQTVTFAIAPLLCVYTDTHARTQMHTHTHSLGSMCWQIKVQSGTGLDQYTYSQENTHPHNLSVCVSWPGFNSSLNVTRLSLGQPFDVTRTKTPMKRWSCWSQLNLMSAWMVTAGDGPRVSYHASTWTGRQIHCVRVEWGTQWMVCTQYGSLYEYTVGLNGWGQTC